MLAPTLCRESVSTLDKPCKARVKSIPRCERVRLLNATITILFSIADDEVDKIRLLGSSHVYLFHSAVLARVVKGFLKNANQRNANFASKDRVNITCEPDTHL